MKQTTLCYPIVNGRVLLAMKKRGFGVGKWNGAGGKVQPGESVEDACRREVLEETGLEVGALQDRGMTQFIYAGHPDWSSECHIYVTTSVFGEPRETEEMRPEWFALADVPYPEMWESDGVWLADLLAGGRVNKRLRFDEASAFVGSEELG